MKLFFVVASMLLAFSAQANDRKIGNVIAVERDIHDVNATCLKNISGDTSKPQSFFSCGIKYIAEGEIPVSKGRAFKLVDESCQVYGETINGVLLITFGTAKGSSTFEASRACLARSLATKDSVKVVVYTLE
ncbi:MAG: hypothetical protein OM95_01495 [Bdellovibrio sp. ArHS]|uniref:hypothetical protein n=1 Tax=Bdellovibrio sp. ArHS TaxID=1569284 RepID=UPI000583088C|nr:hypothetical protein [Bdellovibrio sp. ArHS]KHD89774.1 MAG: hypothetical protein OM95_01495 [Bdellovibrio sp. ArHS]